MDNINLEEIEMSRKFYCEYCGIFLKNSSPQTRREHADGKKHKQRMIEHFRQIRVQMEEDIKARNSSMID